jgi:hypothetical protein
MQLTRILALGKKIIIFKNATAYTWDWYCHLVVDRASFISMKQFTECYFVIIVCLFRHLQLSLLFVGMAGAYWSDEQCQVY